MRKNTIPWDFSSIIGKTTPFIQKIDASIEKVKDDPKKLYMVLNFRFSKSLTLIQAIYSNGGGKDEIRQEYLQTAGFFNLYSQHLLDAYSPLVRFISTAILLEAKSETVHFVMDKIAASDKVDKFLSFLLSYYQPSISYQGKSFEFPDYYRELYELNDSTQVKSYLKNKWYKNQRDEPWYDIHLHQDKSLYSGYWAWDVAAVVKLKGIDPTPLRGVDYFPYDALVW